MPIAPWLLPADPIGAMSRGAAVGTQLRAQDIAAEERAAALALQRDQLTLAQTHYAMQAEEAKARLADSMMKYQGLENARQANQAETQRYHDLLASSAQERLGLEERRTRAAEASVALRQTPEEKAAADEQKMRSAHDYSAWATDYRNASHAVSQAAKALQDFDKNPMNQRRMAAGDTRLNVTREKLQEAHKSALDALTGFRKEGEQRGLLTPSGTQPSAAGTLGANAASALTRQATGGVTPPSGTPAYVGDSPYPEGQKLKRGGKLYEVRGGVPVLIGQ